MQHGLLLQSGNSFLRKGVLFLWTAIAGIILFSSANLKAESLFCPIQPNASNTITTCFLGEDGTASVAPTGGVAPYSVSWSNGATGNTISNLTPGNYQYTITDAEGCTTNSNIYVGQPTSIQANLTRINNECRFDTNGSLSLSPTGGTPPYAYNWSNGATTATIAGLASGPFSYTITDSQGCTRIGSVSVLSNNPIVGNVTVRNNTCYGEAEGSAFLSPSGGVAPYSYQWSNGATTQEIGGLAAGPYAYTVTDSQGCTGIGEFAVQQPAPVWTTFTYQYACFGEDNGRAEIFANGGTPPYTYQWSNGATTAAIENLAPGMYFYTVTDSEGCTSTTGLVCIFRSFVEAAVTASSPDCSSDNDGSASLVVTNGVDPISYLWSNGATTASINNLAPGEYGYTVTDAGSCAVTGSVTIVAGAQVVASVTEQAGGNLQASGSGGTPPYTYLWSNGETTAVATNYTSGTYSVTVTDANGCFGIINGLVPTVETCPDNITYPGTIGFDQYLCAPGNTPMTLGEVDAPSGGSGPLEYIWMTNSTGGPFSPNFWYPIPNSNSSSYSPGPLNETTYFIRCVRTANDGCVYLESNTVVITVGDEIDPVIQHPGLGCFGQTQTYSVSNIAPNANVSWSFTGPVTVNTTNGSQVQVTFIGGGYLNYSVTITQNGCTGTFSGQVTINGNCFTEEDNSSSLQTNPTHFATVYPNPTAGVATFSLGTELVQEAEVRIYNNAQQLLATYILPAGTRQLDLETAAYPAGLYLVQLLQQGAQPKVLKLMKN